MNLIRKLAWTKALNIEAFTEQELLAVETMAREGGNLRAQRLKQELFKPKHWRCLKWFLFGGHVELPVAHDPTRAPDPETNPHVKVWHPGFVTTRDELDFVNPYKLMPDKDYLRVLAYAWVFRPILFVPKSRQLMVTWLFCAIAMHETLARQARRTALLSKKFEDADALIKERLWNIYENLPHGELWVPHCTKVEGQLVCSDTNSIVKAFGQNSGEQLRSYSFSWVFSDEMPHQDEAEEGYVAALPALKSASGVSKYTAVGTPNGKEFFYRLISDMGEIAIPPGE